MGHITFVEQNISPRDEYFTEHDRDYCIYGRKH